MQQIIFFRKYLLKSRYFCASKLMNCESSSKKKCQLYDIMFVPKTFYFFIQKYPHLITYRYHDHVLHYAKYNIHLTICVNFINLFVHLLENKEESRKLFQYTKNTSIVASPRKGNASIDEIRLFLFLCLLSSSSLLPF